VNSDQGLRLKTHPERRSFPGRQQETPVAFRYHTALLVEGLKQLWIVDPTASDRVVDFESWRTLFTSGGSTELAAIQVEFRDQVHFQLDLSAHLSIQLLKAERLVALGTSRLDATDWVSLTDLGPTSVWPTYIIHGHSASGSPDRVDFAPRQTQIKR
jgi:hypothetical protein